jgi:uncharacterized MAPEG superfamily protein
MTSVPACIVALTLYAMWAMFLVLCIGAVRVHQVATGRTKLAAITPGVPHGPDPYWRLNRAHMNVLENLPIFGAIVLGGVVSGAANASFNGLAVVVIVARAIQSLIHISSGSAGAINLRFTAFAVQVVCQFWMAWLILQHAGVFAG